MPTALHAVLNEACDEIVQLEARIKIAERQLEALGQGIPAIVHLRTIPGVGLLSATALVAFVGDVQRFPTARHFASYLGLTPRERSSGDQRRLGHVSKRGDTCLRCLLTHGARAVPRVAHLPSSTSRLHAWARGVEARRGHNVAAIALANKLARIAWAVWQHERLFA